MILENSIKEIITKDKTGNRPYQRNLIKEEIQDYLLNFVYSSKLYNNLIFTGGTCLRKVYGLNRLSEDLDFDYLNDNFSVENFAEDAKRYLKSVTQYENVTSSVSGNRKTVYFKFPILNNEGVFVGCDFSKETKGNYSLDTNMVSAGAFQFFVTSYDLPTMFANKITAFLERIFYKGKFQKLPFKGRDVYDLFWLVQLSANTTFNLKVNIKRLTSLTGESAVEELKSNIIKKIKDIDSEFLYADLYPLLGSKEILEGFIGSYRHYLPKYIGFVLV